MPGTIDAPMRVPPPLGLRHERTIEVSRRHTVPAFYRNLIPLPELPAVLATAWLVALVEGTCAEALRAYLSPGESTVGVSVAITHIAPTPPGLAVTARIVLTRIDGGRLTFSADCFDSVEYIGSAVHERAVIDLGRFDRRLTGKRSKAASDARSE
jgi:fluoroacetyl-CoA thioesterase